MEKRSAIFVRKVKPEIVLIGATSVGRDLASIVATTIETGLTADCTGLDIDEEKRLLLMTRPTFGGNIMATIYCENYRPQMSTVRPKVFKAFPADQTRKGDIFNIPLPLSWQTSGNSRFREEYF